MELSGEKLFCSVKCFRDDKNSIKEDEGGEDEENNENKLKGNKNDINDEPEFVNVIDILDI